MSTLIIVLLTILIAINIFIISIVALNTMKFKDRSSRTGKPHRLRRMQVFHSKDNAPVYPL